MSPKARTEAVVLAELGTLSEWINATRPELEAAYQERMALYAECRALSPPVPVKRLAEVAGVSVESVGVALNKVRKAGE